jgi:hypothetical protein
VIHVRPNRVVLAPGVCAPSLVVVRVAQPGAGISHLQGDGGNSASLPGESTTYAVPTTAQGRPGCPGYTCMPLCRLLTTTPHSGPRVPAGSRSSLRPLHLRVRRSGKARAKCAARMRAHVSHSTTLSCPERSAARSDTLQSRGPCVSVLCHLLGPGSAPHRYALRRVRDTREAGAAPSHSVIASAAKQSGIFPRRQSGLLRCARNDEDEAAVRHNFTLTRTHRILGNRHSL